MTWNIFLLCVYVSSSMCTCIHVCVCLWRPRWSLNSFLSCCLPYFGGHALSLISEFTIQWDLLIWKFWGLSLHSQSWDYSLETLHGVYVSTEDLGETIHGVYMSTRLLGRTMHRVYVSTKDLSDTCIKSMWVLGNITQMLMCVEQML